LRALDRCRVGVPDDLLLVERRRPTGTGFETKDFRITWKDPVLTPELEIKPLVRDLLERVDNRATVPEIIARYARDTKTSVEEVDERCRRAFLAMLERGLVTLDEVEGAAAPRPEILVSKPAEDELISAPQTRPSSSTAAGEPGSAKIGLRRATPAVARESMAALPTSFQESIRKSSPKPGSSFSRIGVSASTVTSRRVTPVPPVSTIARTEASARP